MFLVEDEIKELTGRTKYSAQVRVLRAMGIEHRVRPDGSLAILRTHIEQIFGAVAEKNCTKSTEPNWEALINAKTS